MAECSLLAAGGDGPGEPVVKSVKRAPLLENRVVDANGEKARNVQRLVGCGRAAWGQEIAIVDPATNAVCAPGQVGEIWIKGPSNGQGYWNRPGETSVTFRAFLEDSGCGPYLRTGDLGFIDFGQLYVTGRVKDVVILRGRNHYPQDIESTVSETHPALGSYAGAVFSVDVAGEERLVVLHEVDRGHRNEDWASVVNRIRQTIVEHHEIETHAVVLPRQASLPRTTSGKIQRRRCRQLYLDGQLKVVHQWISRTAHRDTPGNREASGTGRQFGGGSGVCDAPPALFGPVSLPSET